MFGAHKDCGPATSALVLSTHPGRAGKRAAIELIATYLLGEKAPWISFFGAAPHLFQPWSFDVTCRDAVLERQAPDMICHLIASDSTAFVWSLFLLHFGGLRAFR